MKLLKALLISVILVTSAWGQQTYTGQGNINTGAADCTLATTCNYLIFNSANQGSASIWVTGTWSGTLQFEVTSDVVPNNASTAQLNALTWVAVSAFPASSTTGATSTTSNGLWSFNASNITSLRVRSSAMASGVAAVTLRGSTASAGKGGGGGGGAGVGIFTVATLPSGLGAGGTGTLATVKDGASASDCTTGLSTFAVTCIWTGAAWAFAGSAASAPAFSAISTGTNTTALTMGTAGVLTTSGTGIINANQVNGAVAPTSATLTSTNASKQIIAAPLTSANVYVGNGSNLPVGVAISGDESITNAGVVTNTGVNNVQYSSLATGIVRNTTGTGAPGSAEISGDCTTSGSNAITCTKFNGGTVPASATVLATDGSSKPIAAPLTSTNIWVGSAGALPVARAISGDSTLGNTGIMTNTGLNGVTLSSLATGPLFNTTATGVPTVGTLTGNTTQLATWTGATTSGRCVDTDASGNLQITANDCGSSAGSVTASSSGSNQAAIFTSATNITGVTLAQGSLLVGTTTAPVAQTKTGVDVRDTSVVPSSSNDFCAALNAAMTTAVSNHSYVEAGNPGGFLQSGKVFCNSNPFSGIANPPYIHLSNYTIVISTPWVTASNPFQVFGDVPSLSSGTVIQACNTVGGCGPSNYPVFPGTGSNLRMIPVAGPWSPYANQDGTISSVSGTAVVGSSTNFTPQMVDGIICAGAPCTKAGLFGVIAAVADTTHLTLRQATLTGVTGAYTIILPNATALVMDGSLDTTASDGIQASCFGHIWQNVTFDTNGIPGAIGYWTPNCQERSVLVSPKFVGQGNNNSNAGNDGGGNSATAISLTLTSVNTAGVYQCSNCTGFASNQLNDYILHITGFTSAQSNGDFIVTANTTTSVTVNATTTAGGSGTATGGLFFACAVYDRSFQYGANAGATHFGIMGNPQCGPGVSDTSAVSGVSTYGYVFEEFRQVDAPPNTVTGLSGDGSDANNGPMDLGTVAGKTGNLLKACVWTDGAYSMQINAMHTEWCTTGIEAGLNNPTSIHIEGVHGANTNTKLVWLHSNTFGSVLSQVAAGGVSSPTLLVDDATGGQTITGGPNCNTAFGTACSIPLYVQPNSGSAYIGSLTGTTGTVSFAAETHTAPMSVGLIASKPSACTVGDTYFGTDATPGQNQFNCTVTGSPGTWTQNLNSGASGANQQLSNLSAVAVNSSLIPGSDNNIDFGTVNSRWRNEYLAGSLIWTTAGNVADVGICRGAAGQLDVSSGGTCGATGNLFAAGFASGTATVPATGEISLPSSAAPGAPASGTLIWFDSTDLRLHEIGNAASIGTTVVAKTATSNQFVTAISAAGVVSQAQPSSSNLSDQGNIIFDTTTATSNAVMKGNGTNNIIVSDLTESSNVLANAVTTQNWTVKGGADASANSVLGGLTVTTASETGTGGATSQSGPLFITTGSNAATNAASQSGSILMTNGPSTNAGTLGLQGLIQIGQQYALGGGTSTVNFLQCNNGTVMTVNDCGATPNNFLGVAQKVNSHSVVVVSTGIAPIVASAGVTLGHTVCAGGTAGKITDSGGTATCTNAQGATVGTVVAGATSGGVNAPATWTLGDGTTVSVTNVLPLIELNPSSQLPAAGSNPALSSVTGSVAQATLTSGLTDQITFAGVETATKTYPFIFQNTSGSNNTSGALIVTTAGSGNAQVPLLVNNLTGGDLINGWNGATITNGVASGGSKTFAVSIAGVITTGTIPLNNVTSATGAIATIADGNNPLVINCALTSGTTCLTTGETTAATTAGAVEHQITTLTTTTAIPLQITQGAAGPANANAPAVINISAAAAGGASGASNAGSVGADYHFLSGAGSAGGATTGIGGAGGSWNVTNGAGGNAGGTSTNNGGSGGGILWTTGAGGNGGTGVATAGSGGPATFTMGAPGTNSATGTAGAVGLFSVTGNAPASTANATGVAAGTLFSVLGVAGGACTGAACTGGIGSSPIIASGTGGGVGGASGNAVGGAGGSINLTAAAGANSINSGANSNGGNVNITPGAAGTGGGGAAGKAGVVQILGPGAGFDAYQQGASNTTSNTQIPANSIIEQAPAAVTAYTITKPGAGPAVNNSFKQYTSGGVESFVATIPNSANPAAGIRNFNQSAQSQVVVSGTEYYLTNSDLDMPAVYNTAIGAGTTMVWRITLNKTAAGTGTFQVLLKKGTAGTTGDATLVTQTIGTQTAAADNMEMDIKLTWTSTTAAYWTIIPRQSAATGTGFGLVYPAVAAQFNGTVSGQTTTTASDKYGVSVKFTTGTPTFIVDELQAFAYGVN